MVYIQIHSFTEKTMRNQSLCYTIRYLKPNAKFGGGNHVIGSFLVAYVAKNVVA